MHRAGPRLLAGASLGTAAVTFSPDGAIVATGDVNGRAYLWDTGSGQRIATLPNFASGPTTGIPSADSVAFSPGGTEVATGNKHGTYLWITATGQLAGKLVAPVGFRDVSALAFGPGGKILAAGNSEGSTVLWNIAARRRTTTLVDPPGTGGSPTGVNAVALSPDGSTLAVGDFNGTYLWSIRRP